MTTIFLQLECILNRWFTSAELTLPVELLPCAHTGQVVQQMEGFYRQRGESETGEGYVLPPAKTSLLYAASGFAYLLAQGKQ